MLILRLLSTRGSLHGFEIANHIQTISREVLHVEEGSLYPALQRMLMKGWDGRVGQNCREQAGPLLRIKQSRQQTAGGRTGAIWRGVYRHRTHFETCMNLLRRIYFLLNKHKQRHELEEEMRLHRELRSRQLQGHGLEPCEAEYAASRLFGNETLLKEKADDMWGWNWLEDLGRDLKQAGRMLAANQSFAAIAIVTLALALERIHLFSV